MSPSTLVFGFVRNLIDEMVTEEEKRRLNLQNNIEEYRHKLASLCAELHVAPIKVCLNDTQCNCCCVLYDEFQEEALLRVVSFLDISYICPTAIENCTSKHLQVCSNLKSSKKESRLHHDIKFCYFLCYSTMYVIL